MERAGRAAFDVIRERFPACGSLLVLCGAGNNAGDGYVVARLAREQGLAVKVCSLLDETRLKGAAAEAFEAFRAAGGALAPFARDLLPAADLIVDAVLGTGLDRPVTGDLADRFAELNAFERPIIALDIPSGLHADTGAVFGTALRANLTVTFIARKLGLATGHGRTLAGEEIFCDLGVPDDLAAGIAPAATGITDVDLDILAPRPRDAHKGHFGHLLVIGGGPGMPGAAQLTGHAALRTGAGKVTLAVDISNVDAVSGTPELMVYPVDEADDMAGIIESAQVLAIGPGLGRDNRAWRLVQAGLQARLPTVLDADALNLIAAATPLQLPHTILTPHPGEAARLLNCETLDVAADRPAAARELARRFEAITVLKGAGTLVAAPGGELRLCEAGNPGMATAGMGDVLSGVIAALLAQGAEPWEAACTGVLVHARAGDRAARSGERGMMASDVIAELRAVVNPAEVIR
jgi:NAD(P)H-hydrate epimerase